MAAPSLKKLFVTTPCCLQELPSNVFLVRQSWLKLHAEINSQIKCLRCWCWKRMVFNLEYRPTQQYEGFSICKIVCDCILISNPSLWLWWFGFLWQITLQRIFPITASVKLVHCIQTADTDAKQLMPNCSAVHNNDKTDDFWTLGLPPFRQQMC